MLENIPRDAFGIIIIWLLLLFTTFVWNAVTAFYQNNRKIFCISLFLSLISVVIEIAVLNHSANISLKYFIPLLILSLVLSLLLIFVTVKNRRMKKKILTPSIVKEFGDKIPVGICYWNDSGRVLFYNICMESLCIAITGRVLLNGCTFYESVKNELVKTVNGRIYNFTHRVTNVNGVSLHELLAVDITDIKNKGNELLRKNKEIRKINEELRRYSINMEEIIREQEILQTKINVHDRMNMLLIFSVYSIGENDTAERKHILEMWQNSSALLRGDLAENSCENIKTEINELGSMLGLNIIWCGELTEDVPGEIRNIFSRAARETIANALKHAEATELEITISKNNNKILFNFSNNGIIPKELPKAQGGLLTLNNAVASLGGKTEITVTDKFNFEIIV